MPRGAAASAPATQAAQKPVNGLTNADVIRMVEAKLGDDLIISKIKSSASDFDTSIDAILKLKAAGVGEAVIRAAGLGWRT